jgi:predicted metal-binding membrane protein
MRRLAAFVAQIGPSPLPWLFALSGVAYVALAALPLAGEVAALCGDIGIMDVWRLAQDTPSLWSPVEVALDWGLMVVAMMTPLTALQVAHVSRSSLPRRRLIGVAGFLVGYWATWFAAIFVLLPLGVVISSVFGKVGDLPAGLLLALVFSASPAAQWARNECHRTGRIPAFGARAVTGCAKQGLFNGTSCVAACWPWMLVPMTVQSGHLVAMLLVGIYLFAERLVPASRPMWRLPPAFETLFGFIAYGAAGRLAIKASLETRSCVTGDCRLRTLMSRGRCERPRLVRTKDVLFGAGICSKY